MPSAKSISISAQADECGRVQQNAVSSFCRKARYAPQTYRTHLNKSVLSPPIPDGNPERLLYLEDGYRVLLYSNTDKGYLPDVRTSHERVSAISPCRTTQIPTSHIEAHLEVAVAKFIAMKFISAYESLFDCL